MHPSASRRSALPALRARVCSAPSPASCSASQRPLVTCLPAQGSVKLELQNAREEVPHVRSIRWHVILRPRIKIRLAPFHGRYDSLIPPPQFPPPLVVLLWLHLPGKHLPPPLVHQQTKREERHFFQRLLQKVIDIAAGWRHCLDQADLF